MSNNRDSMIWRDLPALQNGYIPAVKRQWLFKGISQGQRCRFPVELVARHPSLPGYYACRAVFAHNSPFTPDWAAVRDLEAV